MTKFKIGQVVKVVGESTCGNNQFLGEEVVLGGVGARFLGEERRYYVESTDGIRIHYEEPSLKKVKESRKELKAYIADLEDRVEALVEETQHLYFDNAKKYDQLEELKLQHEYFERNHADLEELYYTLKKDVNLMEKYNEILKRKLDSYTTTELKLEELK